jgi:hypothetical protein|nr:MAG TPA: hypothetical protein [Caudoviricetes sp.]
METKELKIQVPEGYEIDKEKSTFEKIVFKKVENELPKSWEDLYEVGGWFVDFHSDVVTSGSMRTADSVKNRFPTKEEAEACVALAQLCQLRDRYNDGWKPDWTDFTMKPSIYFHKDIATTGENRSERTILYFRSEKIRDEFLENFGDLIKKAKPLL